jgi:hypothetical protein
MKLFLIVHPRYPDVKKTQPIVFYCNVLLVLCNNTIDLLVIETIDVSKTLQSLLALLNIPLLPEELFSSPAQRRNVPDRGCPQLETATRLSEN